MGAKDVAGVVETEAALMREGYGRIDLLGRRI
jgi:hypothetical protein